MWKHTGNSFVRMREVFYQGKRHRVYTCGGVIKTFTGQGTHPVGVWTR